MIRNASYVAIALMISFLTGCSKQEVAQDLPTSWESKANGYIEENSTPILGHGRYVRVTEDSKVGHLFDFVLSVGPIQHWSGLKAKVTRFWGWGATSEEPEVLRTADHVREMSLHLDGKPVHLPESCYVDLIDLRISRDTRLIWRNGSRVLLYLAGSDAGESYRVKYTIENHQLAKREVWAGEFPEMGSHVTIFGRDGVVSETQPIRSATNQISK